MAGKPVGSGRKKGTPNKSTIPLMERAEALGVNPFEILLLFAKGDWRGLGYASQCEIRLTKTGETYEIERITPDHRLRAATEAAQYLYPKRRAVEIREAPPEPDRPLEDLTDEELDNL